MSRIPNFGDMLKEVRETLKFLSTTDYAFRKDCILIGTIVFLYISKENSALAHQKEIQMLNKYHRQEIVSWQRREKDLMVLWKEDVKHFSKVFQDVQEESAKVKLETEKLKKSDQ